MGKINQSINLKIFIVIGVLLLILPLVIGIYTTTTISEKSTETVINTKFLLKADSAIEYAFQVPAEESTLYITALSDNGWFYLIIEESRTNTIYAGINVTTEGKWSINLGDPGTYKIKIFYVNNNPNNEVAGGIIGSLEYTLYREIPRIESEQMYYLLTLNIVGALIIGYSLGIILNSNER